MARKVTTATSALPPTNSAGRRVCGSIEYLTGPNSADCVPSRNSSAIRPGTLGRISASAASPIRPSSKSLSLRINAAFSYFSAICPAVAENSRNGIMNSAAAALAYRSSCCGDSPATPTASTTTTALRYTLSLKAPSSWVTK